MTPPIDPSRARFVRTSLALAAAGALPPCALAQVPTKMAKRRIPSSGESLPVIGCGTWIGFDVAEGVKEMRDLASVVDALFDAGGTVLDSSPMYGRSEAVTGRLLAGSRHAAFVATKVWASGRAAGLEQMEASMRLLGRIDLLQVHNLLDWKTHLPTLRRWKAEGHVRYVGVTHYTSSAYRELEAVLRAEALDFVQVNYAFDDRDAEDRILPLAAERGVAVLVNRPFGGGGLLKRLAGRPLPAWAADIGATTWSQVLLKFVLSHPAVTCAIPGTGNPRHMAENARAGVDPAPERAFFTREAATLD